MELQLRGITKRFPGVLANDRIDLTVRSGEILGLLGENGAGKTTLMNILYGLYSADEGEILIDGEPQHFAGPGDAIAAGIGMVHQHFMLVPVFTVAENVVLGVEPTRRMPAWLAPGQAAVAGGHIAGSSFETVNWFGWPAWAWAADLGRASGRRWASSPGWPGPSSPAPGAARAGRSINLREARARWPRSRSATAWRWTPTPSSRTSPSGCSSGWRSSRSSSARPSFLVFDEPTAVLTPQEVEEFFGIVRSLRDAGKGIVFITHKLGEVLEIADRITVLRDGRSVGEAIPGAGGPEPPGRDDGRPPGRADRGQGRRPRRARRCSRSRTWWCSTSGSIAAVNGVSFQVRAGEIVGIAGVQGNGQTELVRALTGMRAPLSGSIKVGGEEVTGASPRHIHKLGVAHVPEDRLRHGLVTPFTVAENMVLDCYYARPYSRGIVMDWGETREEARRLVEQFDVRTPSIEVKAANLSGGNQQKVIVAREFGRPT